LRYETGTTGIFLGRIIFEIEPLLYLTRNLERHLNTHQLKLSEEKKLVSEIDALKRSKKTLK
jgi:hypothetical protein